MSGNHRGGAVKTSVAFDNAVNKELNQALTPLSLDEDQARDLKNKILTVLSVAHMMGATEHDAPREVQTAVERFHRPELVTT